MAVVLAYDVIHVGLILIAEKLLTKKKKKVFEATTNQINAVWLSFLGVPRESLITENLAAAHQTARESRVG